MELSDTFGMSLSETLQSMGRRHYPPPFTFAICSETFELWRPICNRRIALGSLEVISFRDPPHCRFVATCIFFGRWGREILAGRVDVSCVMMWRRAKGIRIPSRRAMALRFTLSRKMKRLRFSLLGTLSRINLLVASNPPRIWAMAHSASPDIGAHAVAIGRNVAPRSFAPWGPPNGDVILIMLPRPNSQVGIHTPPHPRAGAPILKEPEMWEMTNSANDASFLL